MTQPIDVLALACEADLLFNEHLGNEATKNLHHKRINAFAALVLERAAEEVEKTKIAFDGKNLQTGFVLQQAEFAIRALKPAQGNDKT